MGHRSRLLLGILTFALGACASPESPGRTAALSDFTGEAGLIWHDSNDEAVWGLKEPLDSIERPETIKLIFTLEQPAYPDCLRIPDGTSASVNGSPMIIDERGSNDDYKGHHCTDPHFTGELRREALDGSDGVIRITDGKTSIAMHLPQLLSARQVDLQPTPQPVARGQTLTLTWTPATRWAPQSGPKKLPKRVLAYFTAPSKLGGKKIRELADVATEGLLSTVTVPPSLAPGAYTLIVMGSPLLEADRCETASSCRVHVTANAAFPMTVK